MEDCIKGLFYDLNIINLSFFLLHLGMSQLIGNRKHDLFEDEIFEDLRK